MIDTLTIKASIVLMSVCDYRYRFTLVDVGVNGHSVDDGVLSCSKLGQTLGEGSMGIPGSSKIKNSDTVLPYIILGDQAFPLTDYLLRPYSHTHDMDEKQLIFIIVCVELEE